MNIGILGLGYVGIVNVACLTKQGHKVWCTDVKPNKTAQVARGVSPINEPFVDQLLVTALENSLLVATQNVEEVVQNSEVLIICVGTPSKQNGEVNLGYLNNVAIEISRFLHVDDRKYLVFRSTVPPGTTHEIYNEHFAKYPNIIPVFYPEFLRESSAVDDFFNYSRMVVGTVDNHVNNLSPLLDILHVNKTGKVHITDLATAEYTKYIDNSFHALKVTFANEIFSIGAHYGVDIQKAHQIFIEDTRLNISSNYLKPGLPFGGSCLPKDLREIQYLIHNTSRKYPLLQSIIPSNDSYLEQIIGKVVLSGRKKIAFLGLSFKQNTDDLRESPALRILNRLYEIGGYQLFIVDPDLNIENLRVEMPHLYPMIISAEKAAELSDLLIYTKKYHGIMSKYLTDDHLIMDFTGHKIL